VGYITNANGVSNVTLDGGKMQLYANKTHGEDKMLKRRENSNYEYQYTEMFRIGDDGNYAGDMPFSVLEAYEQSHNIPPLAPTIAKRVTEMRKGKK
jgi:hypothetical protein